MSKMQLFEQVKCLLNKNKLVVILLRDMIPSSFVPSQSYVDVSLVEMEGSPTAALRDDVPAVHGSDCSSHQFVIQGPHHILHRILLLSPFLGAIC